MTTLKTYHADEIASAMSAQLGDEGFVGLYRKAQANWWQKGPASQAFKAEMDAAKTQQEAAAVHNKWLAAGSEGATNLGKEHDDFTPLVDYSEEQRMKLGGQLAEDGPCPKCGKAPCVCDQAQAKAEDGCPECADPGLAVAIDFAIRHMVKVADALDKVGFVGVAALMDETLRRLAAERPFVVKAARSYKGWVSFLKKKSPKAAEKFQKTYKGALEHAKKEKGLGTEKAEEYAVRTALDGVPKSYLKEPTPEHGKGKSGPKVTKKAAKLSPEALAENKKYIGTLEAGAELLRRELAHLENEVRAAKAGGTWFDDPEKARSANNSLWNAFKQVSKLLGSGTAGFPAAKRAELEQNAEKGRPERGPKVTKKAATPEETEAFKRQLGVKPDAPTPGVGMFGKGLLPEEIVQLWNAIPDIMKDRVLPDWRKADKENLTYNLSNPEVQKRLRSRYDQWNRSQLGEEETPAPQAGKRGKYYTGKLVGQVQDILNRGGVPVKIDNAWGPNTAKAWNTFLGKAGLSTYSPADPRGANPPIEDMRLLVNYGDQILAGMKPSAAKPAAPAAKPTAKPAKTPQVVDVEEPPPAGETERQKELRKRFPGVVGYNPNK